MKGHVINYSKEELEYIKENCQLTRADLTLEFNKKFSRQLLVSNIASLCKRNKWLTGRNGQYHKGSVPVNKGVKGLKGANATSFKKGRRPHNWLPVGTERVKDGYIEIKTAEPNKWEQKHRILWRQAHGVIPGNIVVRFIDNNTLNCVIENLETVTKAENLYLNQNNYTDMPQEIKPTMKMLAALEVKAFSVKRKQRKS